MSTTLSSSQRKYLRGLAHHEKALVHIGKMGLSDALMNQLDEALATHELVKVRFVDFKDQKAMLCDEIVATLHCGLAGRIGHIAIFFRAARDPDRRRIVLPKS